MILCIHVHTGRLTMVIFFWDPATGLCGWDRGRILPLRGHGALAPWAPLWPAGQPPERRWIWMCLWSSSLQRHDTTRFVRLGVVWHIMTWHDIMTAGRSIRGQRAVAWPSWQHSQRLRGDAPRLGWLGKIRKTEVKKPRYAYNFAVRGHRHLEEDADVLSRGVGLVNSGGLRWTRTAPRHHGHCSDVWQLRWSFLPMRLRGSMMPAWPWLSMAATPRHQKLRTLRWNTWGLPKPRSGIICAFTPCTASKVRYFHHFQNYGEGAADSSDLPSPPSSLRLRRCEAKDATTSSLTIHLSEGNGRQRMWRRTPNPWILSCFLFFFDRPGGLYHNLTDNQD